MKRKFLMGLMVGIVASSLAFAASSQGADDLPPLPKGPLLLTSDTPAMFSPDYWIKKIPTAEELIKKPEGVRRFNEEIEDTIPDRRNIFKIGATIPGKDVRSQIELEYKAISGRGLYDEEDNTYSKDYFEKKIKPRISLEKIPNRILIRWGVATRATSVRALPTKVRMFEKKQDFEFDMLQFTQIKFWTPVAIYHTSGDGDWFYIQAPYARGWVKAKDIAIFSSRERMKKTVKADHFLVVTGESIPVYRDETLREALQRPSMGTVLPLAGKTEKAYAIWLPRRKADGTVFPRKAYVSLKSDVSVGFIPYTQANVIRQAFKLLGARYGWGGAYNGRDCSGFTHDVFLSLGIELPRDAKSQGYVGTQLSHFKPFENAKAKAAFIRQATPAITLLTMPHHQMLYLGMENNNFYIIHSTWAERVSLLSDQKNRINQVVVSDLTLNGKSYLGTLFDRIVSANELD